MVIPGEVVSRLREALYSVLKDEASTIQSVAVRRDREKHGERMTPHIAEFRQVCAVLDVIGWSEPRLLEDVEVDLVEHGQVIREALQGQLATEHSLMADDSHRGQQYRKASGYAQTIETFLSRWIGSKNGEPV